MGFVWNVSQFTDGITASLPANILVVDDHADNLRLLNHALSQQGYKVRAVTSGKMALIAVRSLPPDLILLDINMPEMDGYEVCAKLKENPDTKPIPVIFLSANGEVMDKVKAFSVGGVDYITKPFNWQEVCIRIENQIKVCTASRAILSLNQELESRVQERTAQLSAEIIQHKQTQDKLRYQAFHDVLTDLPNRTLFFSLLKEAIHCQKNSPQYQYGILFLDCDRFKLVNDSFGHRIGDQLLVAFTQRLKQMIPAVATMARLGGDEFTILLENFGQDRELIDVAAKINDGLKKPFYINDYEIYLNTSIGIVVGNSSYEEPETLLRDADIAMYQAKESGKACYQVFTPEMYVQTLQRLELEQDLRKALNHEEFTLVYQPIVDLKNSRLIGFEALVRWQHPKKGIISPLAFIPVAEDTGLILPLGAWVLRRACQTLRSWQQQLVSENRPIPPVRMSVNLAAQQLNQENLIHQVDAILQETGLESRYLKLELTESAIIENSRAVSVFLDDLCQRSIEVSIDDFGTGYSSLSYLHRFPVNTLKIDRTFVNYLNAPGGESRLVDTIVTLAHHLDMNVIAEGVETGLQKETLETMGCEYGQGYLFAKPLSEEEAFRWYWQHGQQAIAETA